jgi:predicted phosphohydrolase
MKIQYISDIHLEFYEEVLQINIIPSAPILCLLGDISYPNDKSYDLFLNWASKNYEKIFIISGNHEYYSKLSYSEINEIIKQKVSKYENITFLNNKIEEYQGYTFIGCTLWSNIPQHLNNYNLEPYNDFKKIKDMNREKYNYLHTIDVKFLEENIKKYNNIICLTHHLPSNELVHYIYKNSPNFMFATDLNYLIDSKHIKVWLCGHSHKGNTKIINDVLCSLNPFGYPYENKDEEIFNIIKKTIEV